MSKEYLQQDRIIKDEVYYISRENYDAVKKECAERVKKIEQLQKHCQKLEAIIEKTK